MNTSKADAVKLAPDLVKKLKGKRAVHDCSAFVYLCCWRR